MPLPPVAFHSIYELAFRWNRHPADVAGWAAAGHLNVVTCCFSPRTEPFKRIIFTEN